MGDLNGDGREDALIGGTPGLLRGSCWPMRDRFTVAEVPAIASSTGRTRTDAAFLGAKGRCDRYFPDRSGANLPAGAPDYQPVLLFNDGHGSLEPPPEGTLPSLPISVGAVAAADFDRDGQLDVFLGGRVLPGQYPLAPRSALLANRGGKFEDVTDQIAPGLRDVGMVTSALWSDVDGDGWPDLLLTLEWGQVKYFHNNQGKGFTDWTDKAGFASAGTGWWTSIASADFNGDGRPDYVVGNVGLNTQYHASPEHPALLFSGLWRDSGRQLVEAYYEGEKLYPWRTRKELGAAIPSILQNIPATILMRGQRLGEIVGEDKLAVAQRFAATELRSGVFLSQPDGTYRFEPLPRLAQIAPLQGVVAGDFDGDGKADIYAVQNSYAPIPPVGRFDGGFSQLLRGDGHGHFTAVPPRESGLMVPGDAKALAVLDLDQDGWPDFLVTRNNATPLAFRNQGVAGRHCLSVVAARARGQSHGHRGPGQFGNDRRHDADRGGVCRLWLLQPVLSRLLLRLDRRQSSPPTPPPLAQRIHFHRRGAGELDYADDFRRCALKIGADFRSIFDCEQ